MLNIIDTLEYDNWWTELNAVQTKLSINTSSKTNDDILIDVLDFNGLIDAINNIKTNEYGKYYKDWSNYPIQTVQKNQVIKEQKIGELLDNLNTKLCANIVKSSSPSFTSNYSVENVQQSNTLGNSTCPNYSTTTLTGDGVKNSPTYGITTTYGTDNSGCATGCTTGEYLANGQNANYGACRDCGAYVAESTKVETGNENCITGTYQNIVNYTGYSVNIG